MIEHKYQKKLFLSILSEQCKLYDDMFDNIQTIINTINIDLNHDQQILISNSFKYKTYSLRNALLKIFIKEDNEINTTSTSKEYITYIKEYHNKL